MSFEPISDAVYELLMRQGLRPEAGGAAKGRGMKKRAAADKGAGPQSAVTSRGDAAKEVRDGVEKAIEAAMKNGTGRIVRYVPFLMIVEGGK